MTELIIGRERGVERPRLALYYEGKTLYFGKPGSVPNNVSRLKEETDTSIRGYSIKGHCRVLIDDQFDITIEDITDNNFMYINGIECKRRRHVKVEDVIELGPDRYRLALQDIVSYITSQKAYHIGHLKKVYDDYQRIKQERQEKQGKFNSISGIPGVLSMSSIALSVVPGLENIRVPMIIIAVIFAIAFGVIRWGMSSSSPEQMRKLEEDFRDQYRCPNPSCHRFLGTTPYKDLLFHKTCPYCKAKFEE